MSGELSLSEDVLREANICLYSIDRPGFGLSDFDANKTLDTFCDDIQVFMKSLKLPALNALAFSQGAVFAYALANRGMLSKCVIVAGQDDFNFPETNALLDGSVQGLVQNIHDDFSGIADYFKNNVTPESFYEMIVQMSEGRDRALYESHDFKTEFLEALRGGIGHSMEAYLQDLKLCMSPWGFNIEDIHSEVELWYGGLDRSTVHSPDFGTTLAIRNPRFKRVYFPEEGGSILWSKAKEILLSFKS